MKNSIHKQKGFTLIEAVVAMGILAVGIFALYSMQVMSIDSNARSQNMTSASNWGADHFEQVLNMDFDDVTDTDGDGTAQDAEGDGDATDDDGGNFGLDDWTVATADGTFTSPDGVYTVFWNVAEDQPMENLKTIRVHVLYEIVGQSQQRRVVMDYVKPEM